jgi:hypothetical protein
LHRIGHAIENFLLPSLRSRVSVPDARRAANKYAPFSMPRDHPHPYAEESCWLMFVFPFF